MLAAHRFEVAKANGIERFFSELQSPPYWAVQGTDFHYGDSRTFEFRRYRGDGRLTLIVRARTLQASPDQLRPPEWVTQPARTLPIPGAVSGSTVEAFRRDAWKNAQRPPRLRAYDGLSVDAVGNVWIREYLAGQEPAAAGERWWVFDSTGGLTHALRVPRIVGQAFEGVQRELWPQPVFIDDNVILAASKDADRVPRLNVFRIQKGHGPRPPSATAPKPQAF